MHLKRFQLLHGRWVKSHKIVKFPFENFDPTDYLARVPKETILEASRRKSSPTHKRFKSTPGSNSVDHNENSFSNDQSVPSQNDKLVGDSSKVHGDSEKSSVEKVCNGVGDYREPSTMNCEASTSDLKDFHQHRLVEDDPFSLKYRLYALAVSVTFVR